MGERPEPSLQAKPVRFVLHPYRSLSPRGFAILMLCVGAVSFAAGIVFIMLGAWPVTGFFGLDVALIYLGFKLSYRSGRMYETVDLSPERLVLTRVFPGGERETFDFNPYWTHVRVAIDRPDGRTSMRFAERGREVLFGKFLNDDERKEIAQALSAALVKARTATGF